MEEPIFHRVAIVGGTGAVGTQIIKALLSESAMPITVISRAGSEASVPADSRITVKKGDYDSPDFFQAALHGHDVVICTMGLATPPTTTEKVYKTAGAAGVKWVVPQGWGNDLHNAGLVERISPMKAAVALRAVIVDAGMSYTGFITNPWLDWNIKAGNFSIDVNSRRATLYTGDVAKFNVTTLAQVGRAVARFLTRGAQPNSAFRVEDYKNKDIYVRSFLVSQQDLLASVQRATKTSAKDWKVTTKDIQEYMEEGQSFMQQGEFMRGLFQVLFACLYSPGFGGNYDKMATNSDLGLPDEELDEEIRKAVAAA